MDERALTSVDRRSLVTQVSDTLRDAIIEGKFDLGTDLNESNLAEQLHVGRSTAREALRVLLAEGLIEKEPHHAWRISRPSERATWEVTTVRATLEGMAAYLTAQQPTPEIRSVLTNLVDEMESAAASGDLKRFDATDFRFHRSIVECSGHQILLTTWSRIGAHSWLLLIHTQNRDLFTMPKRVTMHREVLEAILSGDPVRARRAARQHIFESHHRPLFDELPVPWPQDE